jgi:hypothetical protein
MGVVRNTAPCDRNVLGPPGQVPRDRNGVSHRGRASHLRARGPPATVLPHGRRGAWWWGGAGPGARSRSGDARLAGARWAHPGALGSSGRAGLIGTHWVHPGSVLGTPHGLAGGRRGALGLFGACWHWARPSSAAHGATLGRLQVPLLPTLRPSHRAAPALALELREARARLVLKLCAWSPGKPPVHPEGVR